MPSVSQQKCSRCFGCVGKQWCCNTLNVHLELFHPGTLLLGVGSEVRACGHRETLEASLGPPHSGNRMGVPSGPRPQVLLPGPDRLPCPHTYGWLSPAAQNLYFHPFRTSLGFTPVLWGLPELISSSSSSTCQRPKHTQPSATAPPPLPVPTWTSAVPGLGMPPLTGAAGGALPGHSDSGAQHGWCSRAPAGSAVGCLGEFIKLAPKS